MDPSFLRDEFEFDIFSFPRRQGLGKRSIHSEFRAVTQIGLVLTAEMRSPGKERVARTRASRRAR